MVVRSEASWNVSRSPLATRTVPPRFSSFAGRGRKKIIRLEARRFRILKAACGNKFRKSIKLLKQGVVEFASALVGGKFLMPIGGGFQRIPRDKHGARLLISVEPQQHIGKAENGTSGFAATPQDCFRQGVIGAMGE